VAGSGYQNQTRERLGHMRVGHTGQIRRISDPYVPYVLFALLTNLSRRVFAYGRTV
jgi:hypothetical protein